MEEFLRDFNSELENSNRYCNLQYFNNGFVEGIKLPEIHLFDDDNDSREYIEQLTLARLVKTLNEVLEVAKPKLDDKVTEFLMPHLNTLKKDFPEAKIKVNCYNPLCYTLSVSGKYDDDLMGTYLELIKENFDYAFEQVKLIIEF